MIPFRALTARLIAFLAVALMACAQQTFIPRESAYYGVDFTRYTNQGFLITPEKYQGTYESIGLVRYVLVPAASYRAVGAERLSTGQSQEIKAWIAESITLSQGVDSLYRQAKAMGADAIINFSVVTATRPHSFAKNPVTLEGYEVSGFAIRRSAGK